MRQARLSRYPMRYTPPSFPPELAQRLQLRFGRLPHVETFTHRGRSGVPIYRLQFDSERFALRAWPENPTSIEKIERWQEAHQAFERSMGPNPSPFPKLHPWDLSQQDSWVFSSENWNWTLAEWVPGEPLDQESITPDLRALLVDFLVFLHAKTGSVGRTYGRSRGIEERFQAIQELKVLEPTLRDWIGLRSETIHQSYHILAEATQYKMRWLVLLEKLSRQSFDLHWIVRDLWRENLLHDKERNTFRIVDLGASRVDLPLLDFVRLQGSLLSNKSDWESAWECYSRLLDVRDIMPLEHLLEFHRISTVVAIQYWLRKIRSLRSQECRVEVERMERRLGELVIGYLAAA